MTIDVVKIAEKYRHDSRFDTTTVNKTLASYVYNQGFKEAVFEIVKGIQDGEFEDIE